jgi:TorA maturation chaperone TorD
VVDQEALEEVRGRSATYYILSKCFGRPDKNTNQLGDALGQIMRAVGLEPDFKELPADGLETELEYNRLFVGPGRLPCPPYESVWRKDRPEYEIGLLMGPSTRDVIKRFGEAGFVVNSTFKDIPDHISVELEFMHLLCEKVLESHGEETDLWRSRYDEFLKMHLLPWIPLFTKSVEEKSRSPFYKSAARLLREFVTREVQTEASVDTVQ